MADRKFSVVGTSVIRKDGPAKVKGEIQYADDLQLPLMLHGRIKRSEYGHAKLLSIDTSKAEALAGVKAVIVGAEAPIKYGIVPQMPTETALAIGKVRFHGEPVAAVAAISPEIAEKALDLIEVEYEPLPVYTTPAEALAEGAVPIHEGNKYGNIAYAADQEFGDPDKAFADSFIVMEKTFKTSYVNHAFMEAHCAVATFDTNGELKIWSSTQVPHYLHATLAKVLDMPMSKIHVSVPAVGGGFGGKGEASNNELIAALLARKSGRPVKVGYSRREVFLQHRGRHPIEMKVKMGVDREGYIQAIQYDGTMDGGAYGAWGIVILFYTAAMLHMPYKVKNVRFNAKRVYTNKPTCGPMRGLGGVQPRFALESLMDMIAEELGISPYDLKRKNAIDQRHETVSGVLCRHSEYKKCLDEVVKRSGFLEKHGKLPFGRGVGLAGGYYISGTAYTLYMSYKPHSTALIRVDTESGVTVYCGATDIGQGSNMVLGMMAAEKFGLPFDQIHVISGDTKIAPFDLGSFASRVTVAAGSAVCEAADRILERLLPVAAVHLGVRAEQLAVGGGEIYSSFEVEKRMPFWDAVEKYIDAHGPLTATGDFTPPRRTAKFKGGNIGHSPTYGFTAHVAEVEVDTETGEVRVVKYNEAGDCGQPINPLSVEGQVEGSIVMAMGQALFEEVKLAKDGRLLNPNLHDYKVPTATDIPKIETYAVESYDPDSPYGAKEAGEGPIQPAIPAILNAIYDAIGVRFTEMPVTPEKVLAALEAKQYASTKETT
ncbi:MAG: molybdopterin-dependent oxidoreductase [Deltaproteobacteria bacterium]|nr:molybdopterin-dependent oxidoreductase [Deltaproteobacteria bacterium]